MPLWQGYESGLGVGRVRSPPSFFELNPHLKVVPENDYEVVQVYVSAPHQGDTARDVYIEQQFNECVDLPPWQFKNGFIKVGPFEIWKGLRMEKRLHYLQRLHKHGALVLLQLRCRHTLVQLLLRHLSQPYEERGRVVAEGVRARRAAGHNACQKSTGTGAKKP